MQLGGTESTGSLVLGRDLSAPSEPNLLEGLARPDWFPPLPPGYSEQAAWGFHDSTGLSYDFYRAYAPPQPGGGRGDLCRIDEARSFWTVIWPTFGPRSDEHIQGRWVSYAQARDKIGGLSFRRFSSPIEMCDEVPRLLHVEDLAPPP